jgi:hypothetical protein
MKRKPLRCRLGLHGWTKHVRAGQSWLECRHCGKYVDQARAIFGYRDSSRW